MQGANEEQSQGYRADGYQNLMNKYGTKDDVSEQYRFESGEPVADIELTINYEENGLFAKIIDIPADEAISSGFSYGVTDTDLEKFIDKSLEELNFEEQIATAIKWSRLYGGSLVVMLIDDGKELEEPVDWDNIHGIDELLVFERPLITPDYQSIYNYKPNDKRTSKFGMPEFYDISPIYGSPFRVHESRCLLFRNGILPSMSTRTEYRFFGMPEYVRIHKALQETVTAHGNGNKLLDRAVQAIYKMKDLAELLSTDAGEDIVLRRLRIIDMARGIINSIAIDSDGEDYDFKSISFSGVKDIIDSACNMLSAVTNIPQTKLFGRSPAGENATGEGDMENYYKFVEKIQKLNLKNNMGTLIDVILVAGRYKGQFQEIPDYSLEFKPLWSLSETEQASVNQTKAATELTKAQTAQVYVEMQALDASEIRERLKQNGEFTINDILDEEEGDWNDLETESLYGAESEETRNTALSVESGTDEPVVEQNETAQDCVQPTGCGVIVVKDGKVLIGKRKDNGKICGPGGHIEAGETAEQAAIRETREEFGINVADLIPITIISDMPPEYCPSQVFLCTEYYGTPVCFNSEMEDARFEEIGDVLQYDLFWPFELSLRRLIEELSKAINEQEYTGMDGGPGSGRYPKGSGEKGKQDRQKNATEKEEQKRQKKSSHQQKNQLQESENGGNIASASGSNSLSVKAFKNKQHLNNHWQKHGADYENEGMTKADYEKRAVELAESPVGNGIIGYKTKEGYICRYDVSKNDYVKVDIKKGIRTMFKPEKGEEYYQEMLTREGVEDDG